MGSRAHPNSVWPRLNGLHLPRLFPIRSHPEVPGGIELWGNTIQSLYLCFLAGVGHLLP